MSDCIFCRIVKGEIPSDKVYEDDEILAFKDIRPHAPMHVLIIPKRHIASLVEVQQSDAALLGRMLALAPRIAAEQGSTDGFRTIINTGRVGGQEVYHLHIHVLGGEQPLPTMLKY
jgi:histidine triad (HIT) family protein